MSTKKETDMEEENNIIIYNTADGKASVSLLAKDGNAWMNQNQLAELDANSVVKDYLTTQQKNKLEINSVVKEYLITQKVKI